MAETYYEILDVDTDATREEIITAYRERVLEVHPDRSDRPDAAERFDRVTTAKDVLTDGTERARYDRLGHDAYERLRSFGDSSAGNDSSTAGAAAEPSRDSTGSHRRTTTGRAHSSRASSERTAGSSTTTNGERDGSSHHARQRRARRRARTRSGRRASDWFGTDSRTATDSRQATGHGRAGGPRSSADPDSGAEGDATAAANGENTGYTVHDWDGNVDLSTQYESLDHSTAVTVAAIALTYPILVYASLSPTFVWPVNVVVAACTLVLAGYVLTKPRIALATFGSWSGFATIAFWREPLLDPLSILGGLGLAAFWVPFGYAIAVWWVLRP